MTKAYFNITLLLLVFFIVSECSLPVSEASRVVSTEANNCKCVQVCKEMFCSGKCICNGFTSDFDCKKDSDCKM
ncbi:hypothetical protein M5689_014258 [Euphorbia peplus]|nr:hypothetical protein M5689_014258 [Euphorbia peplus]